ncbi:hypothetical protein MKW98_009102 [Papaver atlanticum]|uniref:Uncharacterized protein n=1 Tax=Papaver atlanticum TaxID=357466 RepID=A0AAD4XS20_9MAGN|nr:hypothetical protein MKW98_009102 [Papaver atlanticum]
MLIVHMIQAIINHSNIWAKSCCNGHQLRCYCPGCDSRGGVARGPKVNAIDFRLAKKYRDPQKYRDHERNQVGVALPRRFLQHRGDDLKNIEIPICWCTTSVCLNHSSTDMVLVHLFFQIAMED